MTPVSIAGLWEREAELAQLDAAIRSVLEGRGVTVVVDGEPGIGKTRLLDAVCSSASGAGLVVRLARPAELDRELGWGVVRELVEPLVRRLDAGDRAHVFDGAARLALPVLGWSHATALPSSRDGLAAALHGLYWLTASLAEREPLLLAVDDAHWGDEPSLRWMVYMASRLADLPLGLVVATRPKEPGASVNVAQRLAGGRETVVIQPIRLSASATLARAREVLGNDADPVFCQACLTATGGNPFFLGELLDELRVSGVAPSAANARLVQMTTPDAVARSVRARIARAGSEAAGLARAVAVLGARVPLRRAAMLAALEEDDAAQVADELASIGILHPRLPLDFVHPLLRSAVYQGLSAFERPRYHRDAAGLLAQEDVADEEIAVHLLAVEPVGDDRVVARLATAAQTAMAQGAPDVAVPYLRRALAEPAHGGLAAALLHRLGQAETAIGAPGGLDTLEQAVDMQTSPSERTALALEFSRTASMMAEFARAARVLERALGLVEEGSLMAQLEGGFLSVAILDARTSPEAVRRLQRYGTAEGIATVSDPNLLAALALSLCGKVGQRDQILSLARRAAAGISLVDPDPGLVVYAAVSLLYAEDFGAARALWDAFVAHARSTGSMLAYAFGLCFRSQCALRAGYIADAEEDARASFAIFSEWHTRAIEPAEHLSYALIERGALREADEVLASVVTDDMPQLWDVAQFFHVRGRLRLAEGQLDDALGDLWECGRRLERFGITNPAVVPWRSDAALALRMLDRHDEARALVGTELVLARAFGAPRALGVTLRAAGLVLGGDDGLDLLREACGVLASCDARVEHARALCDLGATLRRTGRRAEARQLLTAGLDLATVSGANAVAETARSELIIVGARPRRDRATGRDALTAAETRVASMAADGLSNRDIAQSLFVTLRTVETHLTHIYSKLSISSRSELSVDIGGH